MQEWASGPFTIIVVAWLAAMVIQNGTDVALRSAFQN